MLQYRGRAATYGEVWYDEELPDSSSVDVVLYRQRPTPIPGARTTPSLTLVVDLSRPADSILESFGKDCRYKVKRADSRDGLCAEFILEPENRLEEFCAFYDAFAAEKGLRPSYHAWLYAACVARQLVLTRVTRDGEALVWHAFLVYGENAWLQYTGSCFRNRDSHYRAVVGRANRWLHWQEMLRFREQGMVRYDWGGLFEDESAPEREGINRFKKEFGGTPIRAYDCIVPLTVRGSLWLPLRDAWRRHTMRAGFNGLLQRRQLERAG